MLLLYQLDTSHPLTQQPVKIPVLSDWMECETSVWSVATSDGSSLQGCLVVSWFLKPLNYYPANYKAFINSNMADIEAHGVIEGFTLTCYTEFLLD